MFSSYITRGGEERKGGIFFRVDSLKRICKMDIIIDWRVYSKDTLEWRGYFVRGGVEWSAGGVELGEKFDRDVTVS